MQGQHHRRWSQHPQQNKDWPNVCHNAGPASTTLGQHYNNVGFAESGALPVLHGLLATACWLAGVPADGGGSRIK